MEGIHIFNPFDRKGSEHEDRLTWAFLVILKHDIFLQRLLHDRICKRAGIDLTAPWDEANILTQTRYMERFPEFLVSVLLTDRTDKPSADAIPITWSDRAAVYDGIIEYSNGLTLIIENKPHHGNVWEEQLSPSRGSLPEDDLNQVKLHDTAIVMEWPEVLESMLQYAKSGISSYTSRQLVSDFLSFMDGAHSELSPYRTFEICGRNRATLGRRITLLVGSLAKLGTSVEDAGGYLRRHWKIAERIYLYPSDNTAHLELCVWPANTVRQARDFYKNVNKDRFLNLCNRGWHIGSHLVFSHIQNHLVWAECKLNIEHYFDYFHNAQNLIGQHEVQKDILLPLLDGLESNQLINSNNRSDIDKEFFETERTRVNLIPGFEVWRRWSLEEVIKLEKKEELERHIVDSLIPVITTWGEEF